MLQQWSVLLAGVLNSFLVNGRERESRCTPWKKQTLGCLTSGSKALVWMRSEDAGTKEALRITCDFKISQKKHTSLQSLRRGHSPPPHPQCRTHGLEQFSNKASYLCAGSFSPCPQTPTSHQCLPTALRINSRLPSKAQIKIFPSAPPVVGTLMAPQRHLLPNLWNL